MGKIEVAPQYKKVKNAFCGIGSAKSVLKDFKDLPSVLVITENKEDLERGEKLSTI